MTRACLGSAIALLLAAGCARPTADRAPCPAGHTESGARAARVVERLASVPEGRELARVLDAHVICFAPEGLGVITGERQLLLSDALDDGENAARLGHLLVHARDGLPLDSDRAGAGRDCEALVARALDSEALAHVVEVRLQTALEVTPTHFVFEFASQVRAAPDEAHAVALVRRYLAAHPTGAPGIDGLAAAYHQRCATGG